MKSIEEYCKSALERGVDGAKVILPESITTAEWVRLKCQFGCPGFGRSHCCPPHTPTPEITRKVIDSYQKAILLHRHIAGGAKRRERTKEFNEIIVRLEVEIFLDGYYKALSMTSGPCRLCKECDLNGLCKHGMEARPSMEACGVDVFKTARDNGFPIRVVRTHEEEQNIFGLILVD
jgi:predicted metal-binding protein